jgi:Na+/proline symporter
MAEEERLFGWPDYLVFSGSMLLCTLIGLVQGIRDRWGLKKKDGATGEEKDMKLIPVIWSVVATSFSSNFVLGFPAEMYYWERNSASYVSGSLLDSPPLLSCL